MNKLEKLKAGFKATLEKHGCPEAFDDLMKVIASVSNPPDPKNPTYRKLVHWIAGTQNPMVAREKAHKFFARYGEKICDRVLKDSACTSEFKFMELANFHKNKES